MTRTTPPVEGRRERSHRLKTQAILAAADDLFRERGYDAVTTAEIAARAGVSNGTLFRHAGSKAELLVRVMNARLAHGREVGLHLAASGADPVEAVVAMLAPLAETGLVHPEVVVAYQRELLFSGPSRSGDLDVVEALEAAVADILRRSCPQADPETVAFAAYAVFSTVYMDLVRVGVGRARAEDLPVRLRDTIRALLDGLLPA